MDDGRTLRDIMKGRLALALVSARAKKCPRKDCARKGRCLGRLATSFHAPIGDCPNMSAAEWRAVSLGVQRNLMRLKPSMEARRAREASSAGLDRISWAEKVRRYNAPEAVAARAEAARRQAASPGGLYAEMLWYEPGDDGLKLPRDTSGAGRRLVGDLAAAGCLCAGDGAIGKCVCVGLGEVEGNRGGVGE